MSRSLDRYLTKAVPEVLPRDRKRFVRVAGTIPFDWDSIPGRGAAYDRVMATLPHRIDAKGPFRYFGADEKTPPFLWTSYEVVGLQLGGTVERPALRAWLEALDAATPEWPLRFRR